MHILIGLAVFFWFISSMPRCSPDPVTYKTTASESPSPSPVQVADARQKALDEWDNVIRDSTEQTRAKLKAASRRHTIDATGASRIDVFHMKDGRIVMCRTKVPRSGAPIMTCDGEP